MVKPFEAEQEHARREAWAREDQARAWRALEVVDPGRCDCGRNDYSITSAWECGGGDGTRCVLRCAGCGATRHRKAK